MSTRIHGYLDYPLGILLLIAPWLFGFGESWNAYTWIPVAVGATTILYSLFTDYELGLMKSLNMEAHLTLDVIGGLFLAASPWIFAFADYVYLPHLILGLFEIGVALSTQTAPAYKESYRRL